MAKKIFSFGEMVQIASEKDIDPTKIDVSEEVSAVPSKTEEVKDTSSVPEQAELPKESTPSAAPTVTKAKASAAIAADDSSSFVVEKVRQIVSGHDLEGQMARKPSDFTMCRIPRKQYLKINRLRTVARVSQFALLGAIIDRFCAELEAEVGDDKSE